MKMKSGTWFIKNKQRRFRRISFGKKGCKFNSLGFTARKCMGRLSQLNIPKSGFLQRKYFLYYFCFIVFLEEFDRFVNGHLQHIGNIFSVEFHFENFLFETMSMTSFAFKLHIGNKLHFDGDNTFSLTAFTTSAVHIERKMFGFETH